MNSHYDVIIIGAGHNGLVCACYLASAGRRVLVLEKQSVVGGAAVTEEFYPGFRNSTASYTVGLLDPQIISDLNLLEHGLSIVPRPLANFLPLSDDESLSVHVDARDTYKEFSRFSERDARANIEFRSMLIEVGEVVIPQLQRAPPNTEAGLQGWIQTLKLGKQVLGLPNEQQRNLTDLFLLPIWDLLNRWFETPHIQAALAFDAVVGSYTSLRSPGSAYGLLHHALGELCSKQGAWGHPIGGMGAITQAMLKQAELLGVRVVTNASVNEILIKEKQAVGVELRDGSRYMGSCIAASVAPQHVYVDLIDQMFLEGEFRTRLVNLSAESAVLKINVALSDLPNFTCKPGENVQLHHKAGIIFSPTPEYMEKAFNDAQTGQWSKSPIIEMVIPSTVDKTLAPSGKHVASLFCQYFPYDRDWEECRERAIKDVFATIDRFAPNFSKSVIAVQALTPLDLEQRFGLPRGDIFHLAHTPSQLWIGRPLMGHSAYRGPLSGLYHCGAGSHPGGGVTGLPGRNAAREILRDT